MEASVMDARADLPPVHVSVESSETAVRTALAEVLKGLAPLKLNVSEAGTVELVMAEALNNIVEHAYPVGDPPGPISVSCKLAADGLHVLVVDQGRTMPDGKIPTGATVDLNVDFLDMPEGGFGWFLIKDLANEIRYERVDWQNRLMFRLAIGT